jgi:T-complex protein 1 subunit delta
LPGGGAPEIEISVRLNKYSTELTGLMPYCVKAFSEALEIIPYTLAENAGLDAIEIVTSLRSLHSAGEKNMGINVKKGTVSDMVEERVIQPALVTSSALKLSTEVVRMILKIDDLVVCR